MSKTKTFIKATLSITLMLLMITIGLFLAVLSYEQGFNDGNSVGSFIATQYIAQICDMGNGLVISGTNYHCMPVQEL